MPAGSREMVQRVLLLTDGQANSGVTDPAILVNTARQQADAGVITTTLGFGSSFNEDVLATSTSSSRLMTPPRSSRSRWRA